MIALVGRGVAFLVGGAVPPAWLGLPQFPQNLMCMGMSLGEQGHLHLGGLREVAREVALGPRLERPIGEGEEKEEAMASQAER